MGNKWVRLHPKCCHKDKIRDLKVLNSWMVWNVVAEGKATDSD